MAICSGYCIAIDLGNNSPNIICKNVSAIKVIVIDSEWAVGNARDPRSVSRGVNCLANTFCPYIPNSNEVAVMPTWHAATYRSNLLISLSMGNNFFLQ